MHVFNVVIMSLEALKARASKGCEQAISDQGIHLVARQIGEALLAAYASAPPDQSVSLKLNLTEIVDCFTSDPLEGDTLQGLLFSQTRWFYPAPSA